MHNKASYSKTAQGFIAKRRHLAGGKRPKISHSQVRHDCLDLALDLLWIGDFPYADRHVKAYENMCESYEKTNGFKRSLSMTIMTMASDNLEKKESEIDKVINKAFDRLEAMTKSNKSK